jgi:hypothetical protein
MCEISLIHHTVVSFSNGRLTYNRPSVVKSLIAVAHLVFLYSIFLLQPAFATSIIAVRVNEQVVVGADSKRTVGRDPQNAIPIKEPVCKIGKGDGFFFATAGLVSGGGFDVGSSIAKASEIQGTIEQKIETVLQTIKEPLTEILDRYRQTDPLDYSRTFATAPVLQILFFGMEKGSTFITASEFFIPTPSPLVPVQIVIRYGKCPGDACLTGEQLFMSGERDAIKTFLSEKPGYWRVNPVETVRELIELQIADIPNLVGPPIDILYVDKNGAQWIQKKDQCPDL